MKRRTIFSFLLVVCMCVLAACGQNNNYVLNEKTFFLVMTNMQYYPEQYENKEVAFDCFTYDLTDVDGNIYRCGVRKCSAGYGCQCGKDTVIGFLLVYDGDIPDPKNQSEDTNEKTWVHLSGRLLSSEKTRICIFAYDANGEVDKNTTETIEFLTFRIESLSLIEDYSNLNYYVTK